MAAVLSTAIALVIGIHTSQSLAASTRRPASSKAKVLPNQTLGQVEVVRGDAGKPNAIPQAKTPETPPEQPKTPPAKPPPPAPEQKPKQDSKQDQPAQQQQTPTDYSDDFFEKNIGNFYYGVGNCKCDGLSSLKDTAVKETLEYAKANRACIGARGSGQIPENMAINDYRSSTGCMYIIDSTGRCVKAVDAAYGIGSNQHGGAPTPGCGGGSLATPSGFHITGRHNGGRYNESNSMLMQDLQGQGSAGRGILIHAGSCSGGACTWGCTGVSSNGQSSEETFQDVRRMLGYGALVYNFFGEGRNCPGVDRNTCGGSVGSSGRGVTSGKSGGGGTSNQRAQ